jgi:hypothetical protein
MEILFICLASLYFIGLPAAVWLSSDAGPSERLWVLAPFLGMAFIVLISQNLIYLGVPIAQSFYWIWAGAVCAWLVMIKKGVIKKLRPLPIVLLVSACLMYVLHSLGLLVVGPAYYVGHGWYDQFNYVVAAQFLMDHSLPHIMLKDILYQPAIIKALTIITTPEIGIFADRIGEVIYQGFVACSSFTDAKSSFEPVILLLPFMIVLVMYEIARRFSLSKNTALIVAVLAASLPSMALIHLESFLSQALAVPLLLLWPCVMKDVFDKPDKKNLFIAATLLALATSLYADYFLIFLMLSCCVWIMHLMQKKQVKSLFIFLLLLGLSFALNPGFISHIVTITIRALQEKKGINLYPWADSVAGLTWLWLGEITLILKGWWKVFFDSLSVVFFVMAYLGLALNVYKRRDELSVSFLALALLPGLIWLKGSNHYNYQFYKLLISVSPLLPLGITLTLQATLRRGMTSRLIYRDLGYGFAMGVAVVTCAATLMMIAMSAQSETLARLKRGVGYKLLSSDTREIQIRLTALHDQNILIAWRDDFRQGDYINGWLTYFARHNRVWMVNPLIGDKNLGIYLPALQLLPKEYLLVTSVNNSYVPTGSSRAKIWSNDTYQLWRVSYPQMQASQK